MIPSNKLMNFSDGTPVRTADEMKLRQKELVKILSENAYGYIPGVYGETTFETVEVLKDCSPNKAEFSKILISAPTEKGIFSFPVIRIANKASEKNPTFILLKFNKKICEPYCPVEELLDMGFNIIQLCYSDVTSDDADFENGVASHFSRNSVYAPGKISLWAWALSRIVDIAVNLPETDVNNIAVIGHSRTGKTALWCGANDSRIKYVISNDSGCMGAAFNENKHENAEKNTDIVRNFPYWFCNKFVEDVKADVQPIFDQHFLLACSAPRYVLVTSAVDDLWADPVSEYDCCRFASPAFEAFGVRGFVSDDDSAVVYKRYNCGNIAYQRRKGTHFLSREDWNFFGDFINDHK